MVDSMTVNDKMNTMIGMAILARCREFSCINTSFFKMK